ncbi:uncharacterized protein LOC111088543 isoform X2 [Limulus polyphemus]|uniref:Uncharacterized protein LOC111088543 isoform X2 n=1 Tax=Limulus polyphemus TaxID=6850 RepID=A0ABM1TFQ8_LIMPO|nr:uncharacterized protein LOC111088543 isoform X2 [Limulus polyphemus]
MSGGKIASARVVSQVDYDQHSQEDDHSVYREETETRVVAIVVGVVSGVIFLIAVVLIVVTMSFTPHIDEILRKENEDIFRFMTSTISPYGDADNQTSNVTGQPG